MYNAFFSIFLTLAAFEIGRILQQKGKSPIFNPILIGAVLVGVVITVARIPVETYQEGCAPLQYLLTPATVCFAVGLYEQVGALKKHLWVIVLGILAGTVMSLGSIRAMAMLFGLDGVLTVSILPKSITTAIGMALSQDMGGITSLTTAVIVITGVLGNMFGPVICRLFRITDPIAQGVAFGTASHAIGTGKAMQMSALAGAVSSFSLTVAGLATVLLFSFFVP